VRAECRRHSHGDGTTRTTCARQGFVLTRLQAKERQGLGSTVACSACGCRRQTGARRHTSNKGTTQLYGKGARAAMMAAALASDRLGSMADSQATLRGGASRQRATNKQRAHKARSSLGSKAGSTTRSRGFRCSPRAPACGGEVVTGRGSGADAEQRMQNRARRGSDRGRRTAR
jgi:hypothetical protein